MAIAEVYSGYVADDDWRVWIRATSSSPSDSTSATITVESGIETWYGRDRYHYGAIDITVNGQTQTAYTGNISSQNTWFPANTLTFYVGRGQSGQSIGVSAWGRIPSGSFSSYQNGASCSVSVWIDPIASHTYTYKANGDGATINGHTRDSTRTKWYGSHYYTPSFTMARDKYSFLGWSQSSSATTASYQAGSEIKDDVDLTFYAVWKLAYIPPVINYVTAYRVSEDGTANDEGTDALITCSYTVDTTISADNKPTQISAMFKNRSETTWSKEQIMTFTSATTGVAHVQISGFDTSSAYDIRVVVTDSGGYTTSDTILSPTFYTIDFLKGGRGVALGHAASQEGLDIGMNFTDSATVRTLLSGSDFGIWVGSFTANPSSDATDIIGLPNLKALTGLTDILPRHVFIGAMNGDADAHAFHVTGVSYVPSRQEWIATFDRSIGGTTIRVNYIIVAVNKLADGLFCQYADSWDGTKLFGPLSSDASEINGGHTK